MAVGSECRWVLLCICLLPLLKADGYDVGITYLESAVAKGAVCLDGSPPAYHFSPGFGAGANNWLVHLEGGGWCNNVTACLARKATRLGSSNSMVKTLSFSGMFGNKQPQNPDFYNWNKVKVRYCDGSSYTGDVERVDPATKLYFRGERIFDAVVDDLMAKGMSRAQNAILAGCSAGGLAAILHCDKFRSRLPGTKVKCFADAGYFIDARDLTGAERIKGFYNDVVMTHGSAKNLPSSCTSNMNPGLCMFPQYVVSAITTPLFVLNAAYDSWQIKNILASGAADPHGAWRDCKTDIMKCSSSQIDRMQAYRTEFLNALKPLEASPGSRGWFVNSCYAHCQAGMQETWLREDSPKLGGTSISKAVGDWFYERGGFQTIDCPYPCDKTCHNRIFE